MAKRQVLSNESLNSKGYHVLNSGIDWDTRFRKNPVLLLEHPSERQDMEPIGRVDDIRLENGRWTGALVFFTNDERGRVLKEKYDQGIYNAVSIGGQATKVNRGGSIYAVTFVVYEVSLVALPSNADAVAYEVDDSRLAVDFYETEGEVVLETLSTKQNEIINDFIMKKETKDEDVKVKDTLAAVEKKEVVVKKEIEDLDMDDDDDDDDDDGEREMRRIKRDERLAYRGTPAGFARFISGIMNAFRGPKGWVDIRESEVRLPETGASERLADESKTAETEKLSVDTKEEPKKETLSVSEDAKLYTQETKPKVKYNSMEPVHMWTASDEGKHKVSEIARLSENAMRDGQALADPANASTLDNAREWAQLCLNDKVFMSAMKNCAIDIDGGRAVPVKETLEKLASGFNSIDFVNNSPDLGRIIWTNIFYRRLLPDNSFARRVRIASAVDRVGIIWAESTINPAFYFGERAPLNAPDYLYDDTPRGLTTKVLATQPVLWQTSNTDILGYDDRAFGESELFRLIASRIWEYFLVAIAEEAGERVPMTGTAMAAAGNFPINPNATGNITTPSSRDLNVLTSKFINEDLTPDLFQYVLVLAAMYGVDFKQDSKVTSILEKPAGEVRPAFQQYDAFDIFLRSRVSAWDTSSSTIVDPEFYMSNRVDENGVIQPAAPPVLTATTYDAGLAFVPEMTIMAMGNINVHAVVDTNNYGWKTSVDVRFGAGVARSNGVGVKSLVPTVAP